MTTYRTFVFFPLGDPTARKDNPTARALGELGSFTMAESTVGDVFAALKLKTYDSGFFHADGIRGLIEEWFTDAAADKTETTTAAMRRLAELGQLCREHGKMVAWVS